MGGDWRTTLGLPHPRPTLPCSPDESRRTGGGGPLRRFSPPARAPCPPLARARTLPLGTDPAPRTGHGPHSSQHPSSSPTPRSLLARHLLASSRFAFATPLSLFSPPCRQSPPQKASFLIYLE